MPGAVRKDLRCNLLRLIGALALLLCGLSQGGGAAAEPGKVLTFTDALGRKVKILTPAQRIVLINGQAAEILCALGAEERIVGVSDHVAQNNVALLSGLKGKPSIGHSAHPSIEKIVELQPDLVIAYVTRVPPEVLEGKLAPLGIPVARLNCYRVDTLEEDIPLLGKIVGREKQAEEYLQYFRKYLHETAVRLNGVEKRVRLYPESFSDLVTYSNKAPAAKVLEWAGVDNIAADQPVPVPHVTSEWVVAENPQVIIKVATHSYVKMGYGSENLQAVVDFRNELLRRPAWDQIDAVKSGRVYLILGEIWTGPRAPVGILYLAKWCYPERFRDLDPEQVHRQWLRKWHHQELKGIYVYP